MKYKQYNDKYFLRLEKGEEIIESLKSFCEKEDIRLGWIRGMGAVGEATIGLFETAIKQYHSIELKGDFEITSLTGSISTLNGEIYLHLHINLGDAEYKVHGGHLNRAVISATGEFLIESIEGQLEREFDDEVGLNLFKFE
jgi:predicted DNA-binding protein with PD1-like motif